MTPAGTLADRSNQVWTFPVFVTTRINEARVIPFTVCSLGSGNSLPRLQPGGQKP